MTHRQTVDTASSVAITPYVAATPINATAMPPSAGPRMAPAWLTLDWYETPWTACSRGMTWASKADRAGRSKPLAMPDTKMTPRIGARLNAGSRDSSASATAQPTARALVIRMMLRRSRRSAT